MKNYRVPIDTYVVIEAESPEQAKREIEAIQEALMARHRLPADEERELMLNILSIGEIVVEPKRDEYDDRLDEKLK